MRKAKGLRIASLVILVTQIALINSAAQTALIKTSTPQIDFPNIEEPSHAKISAPPETTTEESRNSSTRPFAPQPVALKSMDPRKFSLIDRAYLDAFTILNDDNACSRFFGGPPAISALTELVRQLKPKYLEHNIAIRMSGETTTYQSNLTGFSFRLFEKAEVNLAGAFFRSNGLYERHVPVVSTFRPNSRETRVVVLLHELGHLVKSSENRWLLSDDGGDQSQSLENTEQVVSICRQKIDSLSRLTHAQELEMSMSQAQTKVAQ